MVQRVSSTSNDVQVRINLLQDIGRPTLGVVGNSNSNSNNGNGSSEQNTTTTTTTEPLQVNDPEVITQEQQESRMQLSAALLYLPQIVYSAVVLASGEKCNVAPLDQWVMWFVAYLSIAMIAPSPISEDDRAIRLRRLIDSWGIVLMVIGTVRFSEADICEESAPQLYKLVQFLLIVNWSMLFFPCMMLLVILPFVCFCMPCIIRFMPRLARHLGSNHPQGATDDQLSTLPVIKYHAPSIPIVQQGGASISPAMDEQQQQQRGGEEVEEEEEEECSICLSNFVEGEDVRVLPCKHIFHKGCADSWFKMNASCPVCRDVLRFQPIHDGEHRPIERVAQTSSDTAPISMNQIV